MTPFLDGISMLLRLLAACAVMMQLACGTSFADDTYGAFVLPSEATDAIILNGEIGIGTPLDFRRALAARPAATVLILSSPGGLVASGLIIAQDVYDRGLSTFIPSGMSCYSACSFIFFAGRTRVAEGELGVHQMASDIPDPSGVQYSTADILEALKVFDVPDEVISRMLRTPNNSLYVFSEAEVKSLGIDRRDVKDEPNDAGAPSVIESAPPPPSMQKRTQLALYQGLDFYGGDLSSSRMPDAVQCATACMQNNMCQAFTFNANPTLKRGPNCFLKSSTARPDSYREAVSGLLIRDSGSAPTFTVESIDTASDVFVGIEYAGGNLQQTPWPGIRSANQCSEICNGLSECVGFSFSIARKQCWPKASLGLQRRDANMTSGVKQRVSFPPAKVIDVE